ncbi:MAG: hypothetical protein ACLTK0_03320 [Anaerovoracaceae bacterium]
MLKEENYDVGRLSATVGRGGMIISLHGGGAETEKLCQAMRNPGNPPHASSMGAELAYKIAQPLGIPSFIYDSTMDANSYLSPGSLALQSWNAMVAAMCSTREHRR